MIGLKRKWLGVLFFILALAAGCDSAPDVDLSVTEEIKITPPAEEKDALRFAVGAMITPREGFAFYRHFLDYISNKLNIKVQYIDKGSYAEINEMLRNGQADAAFVCSGPYVDGQQEFGLVPLVVPQAYGETVYYSYIIVPADSDIKIFDDLRGKTFAFTDPQSNTGKLVPTYMLGQREETPDTFFQKYIFTHAHDESIKAVAQKVVDGAAVDSLIWEYANRTNPVYTSKTRIIEKSPPYGIPPVVVRPGIDPALRQRLKEIFLNAHQDETGRQYLAGMMIDKFVEIDDRQYNSVRQMKSWITRKGEKE